MGAVLLGLGILVVGLALGFNSGMEFHRALLTTLIAKHMPEDTARMVLAELERAAERRGAL